jgi:hypothetical protein
MTSAEVQCDRHVQAAMRPCRRGGRRNTLAQRVTVSSKATIWRKGVRMIGIRWLAALPFVGILVGTAFVNRIEPLVFGMPLVLAWIVGWVVAGSVIMAAVYLLDPINKRPSHGGEGAER